MDSNGVARRVEVTLMQKMDREPELLSGREEGDEVIVCSRESASVPTERGHCSSYVSMNAQQWLRLRLQSLGCRGYH